MGYSLGKTKENIAESIKTILNMEKELCPGRMEGNTKVIGLMESNTEQDITQAKEVKQ